MRQFILLFFIFKLPLIIWKISLKLELGICNVLEWFLDLGIRKTRFKSPEFTSCVTLYKLFEIFFLKLSYTMGKIIHRVVVISNKWPESFGVHPWRLYKRKLKLILLQFPPTSLLGSQSKPNTSWMWSPFKYSKTAFLVAPCFLFSKINILSSFNMSQDIMFRPLTFLTILLVTRFG